jgi:hypothetical protein
LTRQLFRTVSEQVDRCLLTVNTEALSVAA